MAKGNLFQGMARGVVGDVVFTRQKGVQVSRVRNRNPRNPKTNGQLYQRAIMATIMQAYAAGKAIFDHSFQGYEVGAANQARFMSLNAKRLRAAVATDIANGMTELGCAGRIVGPGVTVPVPWTYQVSEGSLTQNIFDVDGSMLHTGEVADETVGAYLRRMGVQSDDIFTVVLFTCASNALASQVVFTCHNAGDEFGEQTVAEFCFSRLRVKASALSSTQVIGQNTKFSDIFELDLSSNFQPDLTTHYIVNPLMLADELPYEGYLVTSGVIRSRDNQDLRSTCVLAWPNPDCGDYGLTSDYLLTAWSQGSAAIGDSDLILEGGRARRAAANVGSQLIVTDSGGSEVRLVSLVRGATQGTITPLMGVASDGTQYYLKANGEQQLNYGKYAAVVNGGDYGWQSWPTGSGAPDAPAADTIIVLPTTADDRSMSDAAASWLMSQGYSYNAIAG